jgi:hypothetical protein
MNNGKEVNKSFTSSFISFSLEFCLILHLLLLKEKECNTNIISVLQTPLLKERGRGEVN